ncbi:MAG: hypothetical protein IPL52_15645 [Flavobacteriales bacterium]|nr:hypothetical protein [Flavobacteriales bacterium]
MKQRIDHSNYEAWLLDRLEGNLSPAGEKELDAFLAMHPELDPGEGDLPAVNDLALRLNTLDKEALKRRLPPVAEVDARNVDDHLIARLENDLSKEQRDALQVFLTLNPEHQLAERTYALTKLVPEAMAYARKQELQRALPPTGMPTRHTLDDFLVARLEGELSAEQERALAAYIAGNTEAQRSWALMQVTQVRASEIVFADKDALRKGGRVIAITSWMVRLAAAASIALLIGMAWWWARNDEQGAQVADGKNVIAPVNSDERAVTPKDSSAPSVHQISVPVEDDRHPLVAEEERVSPNPVRRGQRVPEERPLPNETPLPITEEHRVVQQNEPKAPAPINVPPPNEPGAEAVAHATPAPRIPAQPEANTIGQTLAATLRERVLDRPAETSPLDGDDAVAAVDRGLKAIGGDRAGLSVARDGTGRSKGFNLRLGRSLAISASR